MLNTTKTYFDYKVKQTFMTTKLIIQVYFSISKSRIKKILIKCLKTAKYWIKTFIEILFVKEFHSVSRSQIKSFDEYEYIDSWVLHA